MRATTAVGALAAIAALVFAAEAPGVLCTWDLGDDGNWTESLDQFGPEVDSGWDCPGLPPLAEINFPHNFSPTGPFFDAEIGDGHTVTVLPLIPIAVSNLTLSDGSSVALVDGSRFLLQDTGDAGAVVSDGTITLDNLTGALSTEMSLDGRVTFSGGGSVVLGGAGTAVVGNSAYNLSSTLVLEDHTFEGAGALGAESLSIRNQADGVIRANRPLEALEIDPGSDNNVVNEGLVEAVDGGILRLIQTAVSNAGGTIRAGTGSQVTLREVTLSNGELAGGGVIRGISTVTLEGPLTNSGTYVVGNGTTTQLDGTLSNSGQITIDGGSLLAKAPATLDGGGIVTLAFPLEGGTSVLGAVFDSGATIENLDNQIQGGGTILAPITNRGTIRADEPGRPLRIDRNLENHAVLEATSGATLTIGTSAVDNGAGEIRAIDGNLRVEMGGSVSGGTVALEGGTTLYIADGSVVAGTVEVAGGATIEAAQFATNRLSGQVDLAGGAVLQVADDAGLILDEDGTYANAGTIELAGQGPFASFATTSLQLDGVVVLEGGGELALSNSSSNVIEAWGGMPGTLVNEDHLVHGSGQIVRLAVTNRHRIVADRAPSEETGSGILTIDPNAGGLTNTGSLEALNGGTLVLRDGDYSNAGGLILAGAGSVVALESAAAILGGRLATSGGMLEVRRDARFDGTGDGGIDVDARVEVGTLGNLFLTGAVANRRVLRVEGSGRVRVDGEVVLTGGGEVRLDGPATRLINSPDGLPGDLLVNVDNRITGTGAIQFLAIQNGGTLAPGDSPGTLFTGSLEQTASGILEIELQGAGAGEFDVVQVSGTATLGGTLRVIPLPGLDVPAGTTFTILTSGGISGEFDTVEFPLDEGGTPLFSLDQVGNSLRLTALAPVSVASVPYESWADDEGLDETNDGDADDPNDDGIHNLAAYFLGIPALDEIADPGIVVAARPGGGHEVTFSSPLTVVDVVAGTEVTTDLEQGSWVPGPAPEVVAVTTERVFYRVVFPADGPRRFGRLTFSRVLVVP